MDVTVDCLEPFDIFIRGFPLPIGMTTLREEPLAYWDTAWPTIYGRTSMLLLVVPS